MCKVLDFLKNPGYHPVLIPEHTERVETVVDFANKNTVDLLCAQGGLRKNYSYFKQYGFNGINLYNLLNGNTLNTAAATLSPTGAPSFTMVNVVTINCSGSLFFSLVKNHILSSMVKTKMVVTGLKYLVALPIRYVE